MLSTGDTVTLDEQLYSSTLYWGIENIEFAEGCFWDRGDVLSIEEGGTKLVGSQLVQSTQSNATDDDGQLYDTVIQFPEAGLEINMTNRDLLASASNRTGSTSAASDIASAEIILLSDS
ncbi:MULTISPECIES: calcium-binding protein [Rhizobium]|uniref:calcium-binding protein n=1 Tax=Rhizobium TaxID=379 RepID=UPI0028F40931|nr:calcium-binding protein [Rhizobium leguminosarum]